MTKRTHTRFLAFGLLLVLALTAGCSVYFNTFFNAKKAFNEAEKAREESKRSTAGGRQYETAIEKSLKVVENHPNSKYYDDAVYILGVSYFHTGQYSRAERRFRELLANYPESDKVREVTLYLAKAKLELGERDDAMSRFAEMFEADYDNVFKAEAADALGAYYQEQKDYEQARRYYSAVRDSLGDDAAALAAQLAIANGYFETFLFRDALGAYLQILGMDPGKHQKYRALFQAALCSFRLQRIEAGIDYLNELAEDELYFDSLGILQLTMAEGYEYDDDLTQAEATYEEVASTTEVTVWQAFALYRLGLIYQIDYDDLEKAKEYFDRALEAERRSPIRQDALRRSTDIGKLETFKRSTLDSTASLAAIDEAAFTQFLLGEHYWLNLNRPESAIVEMRYLVDSFATSYYGPKGMIALAKMIEEVNQDSTTADSLIKQVLVNYPHSDFVPEALEALNLKGTAADTGYARIYVQRAEDFLENEKDIDSARYWYQYVVDNFPESEYYVSSRFALLWITETYRSPGDSSVILSYREFADSFPGNRFGDLALAQIGERVAARRPDRDRVDEFDEEMDAPDTTGVVDQFADTTGYVDPMVTLYRRGRDTLVDLRLDPIETLKPFEFPVEAAMGNQYDWRLYFQLLIDFSGRVIDYVLKIPSDRPEINDRAEETVSSMTFDAMEVSNRVVDADITDQKDEEGYWFVYMYVVEKPEYLR